MRVWSYVITSDRGSAPNFEAPAVTLTVCKPRIRRSARIGDLVLAFNARTLSRNPHPLRWAGVVSEAIPLEHYWTDARFRAKRQDRSAAAIIFTGSIAADGIRCRIQRMMRARLKRT
jgi:hypothetical protein